MKSKILIVALSVLTFSAMAQTSPAVVTTTNAAQKPAAHKAKHHKKSTHASTKKVEAASNSTSKTVGK